jgi:putative sterol carrier protein
MSTTKKGVPLTPFVKFKPLSGADSAVIWASFEQMVKALAGARFAGVARFRLIGDPQEQSFNVAIHSGTAKLENDSKKVNLEIITGSETWLAIAQGTVSPLEAFTQGKLRVRGDVTFGQRIMAHLGAEGGRLNFC